MTRKRMVYVVVACTIAVNLCLASLAASGFISTRTLGIAGLSVLAALIVISVFVFRRLPPQEKVPPEKTVRVLRSLIFLYAGFGVVAGVRGAMDGWTSSDTTGIIVSVALVTAFFLAYRQAKRRSGE